MCRPGSPGDERGYPALSGSDIQTPVPRLDTMSSQHHSHRPVLCPSSVTPCCNSSFAKVPCYPQAFLSIPESPSPAGRVSHTACTAQLHGWAPPAPSRRTISHGKCPLPWEAKVTLSLGVEVAWPAGVPAHLQPQYAVCLLHHHTSAPNLCPAQQAAAAFCVPSKGYSLQLGAMSLCLSLHHLPSPLEAVLLSPPHCSLSPCPGLAAALLLGLPGVGLGPPKSGSSPLDRGALPGPGSCSHMGTSISRAGGSPEDVSGAQSAAFQLLPQSCLGLHHHCSRICLSAWSQGLRQAGLGNLGCTHWQNQSCCGGGCMPGLSVAVLGQAGGQATTRGLMRSTSMAMVVDGGLSGAAR